MTTPVGTQIRRWFFLLTGLLLAVDGLVLGGSWVVARSVTAATERAQPVAGHAHAVQTEIVQAQKELFRHLAEFAPDTSEVLTHLDRLDRHVRQMRGLAGSGWALEELDAIDRSVRRYRKVLGLLPGPAAGVRDWERLREYSATAVRLGADVEQRASALAGRADDEIRILNLRAARLARAAQRTAAGVLVGSLVAIGFLVHWWKRFQDEVLEP